MVQSPDPIVNVRVLVPVERKPNTVTFLLLASNVPLVKVKLPTLVKSSCSCQLPPTPLKVIPQEKDVPPVVIVFADVALNVSIPVPDHVVVAVNDIDPLTAIVPVLENVHPVTLFVKSKHNKAPVNVTIPGVPLKLSKKTESAAVGTDAPLAPPEDADQTVVLDVFQVPEPPTQYLFAIL
jgi:hypothetical protein